jgi:hypothetical protein
MICAVCVAEADIAYIGYACGARLGDPGTIELAYPQIARALRLSASIASDIAWYNSLPR